MSPPISWVSLSRPGHAHPGRPQLAFVVFVPLAHTEPHQRIIIQLRGDCKGFFRRWGRGADESGRSRAASPGGPAGWAAPAAGVLFFPESGAFPGSASFREKTSPAVRPASRAKPVPVPPAVPAVCRQSGGSSAASFPAKGHRFWRPVPSRPPADQKRGESIGRKFQCKCLFLPGRQQAGFGKGDQPAVFFLAAGRRDRWRRAASPLLRSSGPRCFARCSPAQTGAGFPFQAQAAGLDGKLRVGKAISKSKSNRYVKGVKVAVSHKNPLMVPNGAGGSGKAAAYGGSPAAAAASSR